MIKALKLTKIYRTESVETTAVNQVDLTIEEGDFVSIMGSSGSGKSTLLNIIGLLDRPTKGEYFFNGKEISGMTNKELAHLRRFNLGFIFQNFNLIDELTVFENVELPMLYTQVPVAERKERALSLLKRMGIEHRKDHYPQQLSGGQQQRVAVCRALANNPKLILADEPTGNLDSTNGNEVMEILAELNAEGTTILMVTHSEACAAFSHRIIRVLDGQIVKDEVIKSKVPVK